MKTLLKTIFGRRQTGLNSSDSGPAIADHRRSSTARRRQCERLADSERLEPRLALAVGVLEYGSSVDAIENSIRYPGRVYVASNNASDVFIQRVASAPEDLLIADNGSFLGNYVVNSIANFDGMLVTNGVSRSETVEATKWWLFPNNTTRLALTNNDLDGAGPASDPVLRVGEYISFGLRQYRDISGFVRYQQADGVVSEWTFTAWDGSRVLTDPRDLIISSGPGYASRETSEADRSIRPRPALLTGYIYPTSIAVSYNGEFAHLEIEWSATPVRPPVTQARYIFAEEGNFFSGAYPDSSTGTAANPSLTFDLPGARTSVYDGRSQQVSLGVIPGTLAGSLRIGSLSASLADRVAVNGSTSLLLNGTQASVLGSRVFRFTPSATVSYFIGTGGVGTHSFSIGVTQDESNDDYFRPEGAGDTYGDFPFVGWNVNTSIGQSVTATVRYLVFARDPQANTVTFAPGLDIENEITVDLLTAGSTINVNSLVNVSVPDGDIDLRATNININAPVATPDRVYIGRSQTHVNQPRLLRPLEAFGDFDYDDGLVDTPTFNPFRVPGNVAKQVVAQAEVSPDGAVRRLVVLPGDEGYGYDPDNPPEVYVGVPSPQVATAEVIALSGSVVRAVLDSGGAGYQNGATALASQPEYGFVGSTTVFGGFGDYRINGLAPQRPPLVIFEEPNLLDPDRIGYGRRAEAVAAVDPSTGAVTLTVTDGGLNYERAPVARVAIFLEATVDDVVSAGGSDLTLTLSEDFRDAEFLELGMPVEVNRVAGGVIQNINVATRQVTVSGTPPIGPDDSVRFYLNQEYLDNESSITPAGQVNGNLDYDTATFGVSDANGVITNIFLLNPGSGYKAAPTITIIPDAAPDGGTGGGTNLAGSGATATAVFGGGVAEAVINLPGSNYRDGVLGPILVTGAGGGGGAINLSIVNGSAVGGTVVSPGANYSSAANINNLAIPQPPPLTAAQVSNRAAFRAVVEADGSVRQFELISTGSGYVAPPSVSVGSPLTPASASATSRLDAASGSVKEVVVSNPGLLYAWTPKVSIAPPPANSGGIRARAQAFLNNFGQVERIEIVDAGSGYESRPEVWVEPQGRFTVVESLQVNASLNANIYEIYVGDDAATPDVPKGIVNLSPEAVFGGAQLQIDVTPNQTADEDTDTIQLDITTASGVLNSTTVQGMTISGNGIAPDTTVTSWNSQTNTITLSQPLRSDPSGTVRIDQPGQTLFLEAAAADIRLGGRLDVDTQSYLLASTSTQQAQGPFQFVTRAANNNVDTGRLRGGALAVTLGNDLLTPNRGGIQENLIDLDINVDSLRMAAAESEENPSGPFPYSVTIREEDDIDIDAVMASSGDISIQSGGDLSLNSAFDTYGGISIRSGNVQVSSRLSTVYGAIDIEGQDLRIANSLQVMAAVPDPAAVDILLRATAGSIFLQGEVSATNKIILSQTPSPADSGGAGTLGSVFGPALISTGELILQAESNVDIRTNVDTLRGFGGNLVAIEEADDINIVSLKTTEGGAVSLMANGTDRGAVGANPIALKANVLDANTIIVSAPQGSIDVIADSVGSITLGDANEVSGGTAAALVAGGAVTFRSRAGDVVVIDAPFATSSTRTVDYATSRSLPPSDYYVSTTGFVAAVLSGSGDLNNFKDTFGIVDPNADDIHVGDRILVKDQEDDPLTTNIDESRENGVYVVSRLGGGQGGYSDWQLTRAPDSLRSDDFESGSYVKVFQEGRADDIYWVAYTDDLRVNLEQTLTNQLVLPETFGQIGDLRVNQPVVGGGIGPGAVITSIDYENRVVSLGLRNKAQSIIRVINNGAEQQLQLIGDRPLLTEAILAALNEGEQVRVSGAGLTQEATIVSVDATTGLFELSPGSLTAESVAAGNRETEVTVGFVEAASGRRTLNPAVRTFLLQGEVLSSNTDYFTVSKQFSNFDSLYVGQLVFGDGVLPDTRITRLNPADREIFVTPGGLPEQLPGPSRFESDSPSQVFRSRSVGVEAANEFVTIDKFTFFNFDLLTDTRIDNGLITLQGSLFNGGTATVRAIDEEKGVFYLDPGAQLNAGDIGDLSLVISGPSGNSFATAAIESGVVEDYDYLVFSIESLPNLPAEAALASGQGVSSGARVLRTIVDAGDVYGFGANARVVILAPNSLVNPPDVEFVTFVGAGVSASGPLEAGRFQGVFSGDLLRLPSSFGGLNTLRVGDPVSGPGIRADTFIEGIDLNLNLVAVTTGGISNQDGVPFVEFSRAGVVVAVNVIAASSRLAGGGTTITGSFDADRIFLERQSSEFEDLQLGAAVQGPGIATGAVITGFDKRTGIVGLSQGALEDPEAYRDEIGGRITLQINLPVDFSSEVPSVYHVRDFEKYLIMDADFADYDRLHVGQQVQGYDAAGQIAFTRFVTAFDPFRRLVGLSAEPLVPGVGPVENVLFKAAESISFGLTGVGDVAQVTFAGNAFGSAPIHVLPPVRSTANGFVQRNPAGIVPDSIVLSDYDNWDVLNELLSNAANSGNVIVTGTGIQPGTSIQSVDIGSSAIKLSQPLSPEFLITGGGGALLGLNFHAVDLMLDTSIGSDQQSGEIQFIVSSTGGTNLSPGGLGKSLSLFQSNDLSRTANPDQQQAMLFLDQLSGVIELEQELPEITSVITIDGDNRYTPPSQVPVAAGSRLPVVVDGAGVLLDEQGYSLRASDAYDGFRYVNGSAGSALRNITIGGFFNGSAVSVDNVPFIQLDGLALGVDENMARAVNRRGVTVSGPEAKHAAIVNSTITGATQAGVVVEGGASGVMLNGNQFGTQSVPSETGVLLASSGNFVGAQRIVDGLQSFTNGLIASHNGGTLLLSTGLNFNEIVPGMGVFVTSADGSVLFNNGVDGTKQNVGKVIGVDTFAGTVLVDGEFVGIGSDVQMYVSHLMKGAYGDDLLEIPSTLAVNDLYVGQEIAGDGIAAGTIITEVVRGQGAVPSTVRISTTLANYGFNRTSYRRVRLGTAGTDLRNVFTNNRYGVQIGFSAEANGAIGSDRLQLASGFDGWATLSNGMRVRGPGIPPGATVVEVSEATKTIRLSTPLTARLLREVVTFEGGDENRIVNSTFDGNLYSGVLLSGGERHEIGQSPVRASLSNFDANSGDQIELASYALSGVSVASDGKTLTVPQNYFLKSGTLKAGMRVYGEGVPVGTTIAVDGVSEETISADGETQQVRVATVVLSNEVDTTVTGSSLQVSFGLDRFISVDDAQQLAIGLKVSGDGVVDYTEVEEIVSYAVAGSAGRVVLSTPDPVMSDFYENSRFRIDDTSFLVFVRRDATANEFINNGIYGIDVVEAAFKGWDDPVGGQVDNEPYRSWVIAGNMFGVNRQNVASPNEAGDINPGLFNMLGAGQLLERGFDKVDRFGNQYGVQVPPTEAENPTDPDANPPPDEEPVNPPGDGSTDPFTPSDPRVPVIRF